MISPKISTYTEDTEYVKTMLNKAVEVFTPIETKLVESITELIKNTSDQYNVDILPLPPTEGKIELLFSVDIANPHL